MAPTTERETPMPKKSPGKPMKSVHKSPKAPGASALDSQVIFLWTCLEHVTGTSTKEDGIPNIDFGAVARKLDIQKGAASKRFSRLRISMRNKNSHGDSIPKERVNENDAEVSLPQDEQFNLRDDSE